MPEPKEGEEKKEFIQRCIPIVIDDGTAEDGAQAYAICNSMWEQSKKSDIIAVKAIGDWQLDVLAIPYGGPQNGKDNDNEYFSPRTDLFKQHFQTPIVTYYHGYDPNGKPQGEPEVIGQIEADSWRETPEGHWVRVILDKASEYAKRVWEAAQRGIARASSGSIAHLVRTARDGEILKWPLGELAIFDAEGDRQPANNYAVALPVMKSVYSQAGVTLPDIEPEINDSEGDAEGEQQRAEPAVDMVGKLENLTGDIKMDEKELIELLDKRDAQKAEREKAEREREAEIQARIDEATKKATDEAEAKFAKSNRIISDKNVTIAQSSDLWKYDNLTPEDQAVLVGVLQAGEKSGQSRDGATESALKALAVKLTEDKSEFGYHGKIAMKHAGIKSDEIQQQDLTSYGDEWVGVAYSNALWEKIRAGSFVADKLPKIEFPAGHESIVIPLESGDPTFYKVAEATDTETSGWPNATITSSQMGTSSKTISLVKMGARVLWSGELEEDSLIPWVSQLRAQLAKAGAEQLEHAIIDGDTDTTASTNINDIGGTPDATDLFLLFNGFRKSPLITTTANSRSGGALTAEDYLETLKLMGTAGLNAADITKVGFIVDPNVYWKTLELEEVKTRDVFVSPTIENGMITGLWGYELYRSYFMHYKASDRKANSAGKVDQDTTTNNTTGSILAVRWDQWLLGYRRRMTMETTRIARADTTEIVALARLGLAQRDTEASAITYNITV